MHVLRTLKNSRLYSINLSSVSLLLLLGFLQNWEIHFISLNFKMEVTSFQVLSITILLSSLDIHF